MTSCDDSRGPRGVDREGDPPTPHCVCIDLRKANGGVDAEKIRSDDESLRVDGAHAACAGGSA